MDYLVETFKAVAECDITTQQKLSSQQFFSGIFQTQRESNYSKWSLKVMVGCHWQLTLFFVIHLLLQLELSFSATRGQILLEGERGFSSVSTLNCVLMLPTRELFAKLFRPLSSLHTFSLCHFLALLGKLITLLSFYVWIAFVFGFSLVQKRSYPKKCMNWVFLLFFSLFMRAFAAW